MNRWLEIAFTIGGAILVAYMTMSGDIKSNSIKIEQLEKNMVEQRAEFKEIRMMLLDIQLKLVNNPDPRRN